MTTFLELCDPFRQAISSVPSDEDWNSISELSKLHGVTPFFYYRAKALGLSLPPQLMKEWRQNYLLQIVREFKARRQIKEIKEILASEEIPMILLKGTSAMMRLYPDPGLRTFCDLDILIPEEKVSQFKRVMVSAGYKPLSTMNSPEDERLRMIDQHLDSFGKEKSFVIEPHVNIFRGRGDQVTALSEIWEDREETSTDGIVVGHLDKEQFIVHTLFHCARDLPDKGFVELKGFIDVLYALRTWRIDWAKFRDTARRWGVEKDVLPVTATLNQYWKADIPLTEKAVPLDLQTLVLGVEDQNKHHYAAIPVGYIKRLFEMRALPDIPSRVRHMLHIFFPTRQNLRWRYNISSKRSILPYYFLHLFVIFRKFFIGLWHQFLYHPRNGSITG
jgi:hypothetical protein